MARGSFGGGASDYVEDLNGARLPGSTVQMFAAPAGGAALTDLLVNGSAASSFTAGPRGYLPVFSGPDGLTEVWADAGGGGRVRLLSYTIAAAASDAAADTDAGLRVDGEIPRVTTAAASTIPTTPTIGFRRLGDTAGADMDGLNDPTFWIGGVNDRAVPLVASPSDPVGRVRTRAITGGAAQAAQYAPTFRFQTDATHFEFVTVTPASFLEYSLVVDGRRAIVEGQIKSTAGTLHFLRFDFGTSRTRVIDLTVMDPDAFGIRVPSGFTTVKPAASFGPRLWVDGDSIVAGANNVPRLRAFPTDLGRALGFAEVVNSAVGGTNWSDAGITSIGARLASNVRPYMNSLDTLLIVGSRNDPAVNATAVTNAAKASLDTFAPATFPRVIVAGTITDLAINEAVKAAAAAAGRRFLDLSKFITGTGTGTAPNGTGNSDRYISFDGVHQVRAGHDFIARRIASLLSAP